MLRTYIFILLLILTLPARANLGETVEQCVARYGKPDGFTEANPKNPFGTVAFTAAGYTLVIFILNDKEVGARFTKVDKSPFTDADMQNIMTADSASDAWTSTVSSDPTCLQWSRGDKATVLYDKTKHVLIFTSDDMAKALNTK